MSPYPSSRYAWYTVVLLTVAYVFSYIDRYILGLLVEPIKADLNLTDTQIGLLLGPAFAIFYATMGLPLGLLADRKRRTLIVAAGITLWSVATAGCGLARNFFQLFLARMSVGVGEAALSPCAMSMISDSFPKERRGRPIAFYSAAISLGSALASLLGASVLIWTESADELSLPFIGAVNAWQFAFIAVGLPGLLVAIAFLFLREPPRIERDRVGGANKANLLDMLRFVKSRWRPFGALICIFCVMTVLAYSHGWHAALFQRTWGWDASRYALVNGVLVLIFGPASVNFGGWLCDRWFAAGKLDAPIRVALLGMALVIPTEVLKSLVPNGELAMAVMCLNTVGFALASATGVTALLNITPGNIRGQTVALYYMCISLSGLFIGPPVVGWLSDAVFGEAGLRYSMIVLPIVLGIPLLLGANRIRLAYLAEYHHRHGKAEGPSALTG